MKTSENTISARGLYESLGKLFYAIAAADKVVRKEEIQALNKIVEQEWVLMEDSRDEFGTDLGFQIEVIFDWYQVNEFSADAAFEKFEAFKKGHEWLFDDKLNRLIWKTVNRIAAAFPGKNRLEVVMLIRLRSLLGMRNSTSMICQSCGLPYDVENSGTGRDQHLSEDYCLNCYENGEFKDPSLTLLKLESELTEKAFRHDGISAEEAERLIRILPGLKRWQMNSI